MISKYNIFKAANYFSSEGLHSYLGAKTFRKKNIVLTKYAINFEIGQNDNTSSWKSTGLSGEKIINPYELDTNISPKVRRLCIF